MKRVRNNDINYIRLPGKDSDEDETELHTIRKTKVYKEISTVDKVIEEGDTLQSLSIQYHCPIAELKRLNNIHRENEIFARNSIKVPARPFSMAIAGVHDSGDNSPNGMVAANKIDENLLQSKLDTIENDPNNFNAIIFNSNVIVKNNPELEEDLVQTISEEVHLLPQEPVQIQTKTISRWSCNGADADISWIALIACVVIVIFAVPLIYVFYVYEHPEEFHHAHHEHV